MFKENTVFILLANWFLPVATYNGTFLKKYQLLALIGDLEVKMQFLAVFRHLEADQIIYATTRPTGVPFSQPGCL